MGIWFESKKVKNALPLSGAIHGKSLGTIFNPPKIYIGANLLPTGTRAGKGIVSTLKMKCPRKRAFLITDKFGLQFATKVAKALEPGGFTVQIWDEAEPESPLPNVEAAATVMSEFEPDVIFAVGGGSALDVAKGAWVMYERPDFKDLAAVSPTTPFNLREKAIFVAVPTTAGTGSECTSVTMISDKVNHRKIPLTSRELMPDYALLLPEFTLSMPPKLTVGVGLDVLTHATDAILAPNADEITEALGSKAAEMVFRWLPRAYHNGNDREARHRMLFASTMAGLAFEHSSVALTHAFGHVSGANFNLHHGLIVSMFMTYAMQFYRPVSERWKIIAKAVDVYADDDDERFEMLINKFKALYRELNAPLCLKDFGITEQDLESKMETLVKQTMKDVVFFISPRPASTKQVEKIYRYAFEGKDIDF